LSNLIHCYPQEYVQILISGNAFLQLLCDWYNLTIVLFLPVAIWSTEELHKKCNRNTEQHRRKVSWYLNYLLKWMMYIKKVLKSIQKNVNIIVRFLLFMWTN